MSLLVKHLYRFGPFDLDAEQRLVRRDGTKIALPPKAFDLLLYMVRNPLRLLTKEELLRAVWPDSFVEEGNLSQNIFLLRKALTTRQNDFRYIVTIPGRGYQFASAVELINQSPQNRHNDDTEMVLSSVRSTMHFVVHEEIDDASSNPTAEVAAPQHPVLPAPGVRGRGLRYALAALLVLAVAAGSFFWVRKHHQKPSSRTIVVADFENRTGDQAFDVVLKKALEIGLGQSPYMDVMSEQQVVGMLQLMGRKGDAPLTHDVATEICQRSNRQVMLQGSIANLGRDYLLTLQATDCLSGKKLAEAKAEAADKERVLGALDLAAEKLRHGLGESGKSVERFQVPIAQATTSSLEALKAYSIGEEMVGTTGREETETLPMFQRAVELDPQFAMAYAAIATDYYNLSEYNLAKPSYQKAFDLSGQVSEKEKLYIRAHYYADDLKDLEQGIKEYQLWAETYPLDWGPWLNIANAYTQLGQYAPAIAAGEKAVELDSSRGINYSVLARAYVRVNRYTDARAAALRAVAIGKDSYGLHATLFQIAFLEHDQAAMAREINWGQGRSSAWFSLYIEAFAAATAGKYKQAEELFRGAYDVAERENLAESANDILIDQAVMESEIGLPEAARVTLSRVKQQYRDDPDFVFVSAQVTSVIEAEHFLVAHDIASRPGTLMTYVYLPRLRAELALLRANPLDAVAALEPTRPYELAGGFTVLAQRAEAYLKAGQIENAVNEYNKILAHRGVDPVSPLFPLAHLHLARIDAGIGKLTESKAEYEKLFALWEGADNDLPLLVAARKEYSALTTVHP
jgi:DNA-binding winged helix-turn-helix (wHTH) protein/tetratricopeptide (TPR) repeat protein